MAAKRELFITYSFTARAKGRRRIGTLLNGGFVDTVSNLCEKVVSLISYPVSMRCLIATPFFILISEYSWLIQIE